MRPMLIFNTYPIRGAESLTSIMRGDTQMTIIPVSTALDLINSKKLRATAIISPRAYPFAPRCAHLLRIWAFRLHVQRLVWQCLAPAAAAGYLAEIGRAIGRHFSKQSDIQTARAQQGVDIAFSPSDPFDKS